MESSHEPISLGSPRFHTVDTGAFQVTEAWFPPRLSLDAHTHERAVVSVMLDGSFITDLSGTTIDCSPQTLWTEPRGEKHSNVAGSAGAHVIVMQPDPAS
jgi:quercetin dioxygenase-like cupin family protein